MDNDERKPLTVDEHEALLIQISNANGNVGSMTEALQSLRENYNFTRESYDNNVSELQSMNDRYKELEQKNLDLFMRVSADKTKADEKEDIEKDDKVEELTYEDLFDERQGG